jgi:hypothetical protein
LSEKFGGNSLLMKAKLTEHIMETIKDDE